MILLLICFLLLFATLSRIQCVESFVQNVTINDPYNDQHFAHLYYEIFTKIHPNRFQITDLITRAPFHSFKHPSILDIGTGGSKHLFLLQQKLKHSNTKINFTGIDSSEKMLRNTKSFDELRLVHKNIFDETIFAPSMFSHITLYGLVIYELDFTKLPERIHSLLQPNGWCVVQVVPDELALLNKWSIHIKNHDYILQSKFINDYFQDELTYKNKPVKKIFKRKIYSIQNDAFINKMGEFDLELKHVSFEKNNQLFQYLFFLKK